ncbi:hypothetical protein BAE44_0011692 [Dichanthelium oligosanthes]|uniref:Uncharacterized protein n=1 Tax=Dichanthelium oligosanthes TaxID=888268 RepID=A0A1E5VQ82_9POAL|nr:hypothetical protein BAE44_0011692 [Dichanthelium oligosanthes]
MHFFPVANRRVVCVDQLGRGVLLEADTGNVVMMPPLHRPKSMPISLSLFPALTTAVAAAAPSFGMERVLKPEAASSSVEQHQASCHFEAFVYRKPATYFSKSWQC